LADQNHSKMSFLSKARTSIISLASATLAFNPTNIDPPLSTFAKRPVKIDANEWNEADFDHTFQATQTPVLCLNCTDEWRASKKWTLEKLTDRFQSKEFSISIGDRKQKMTLQDFRELFSQHTEPIPYLFHQIIDDADELLIDYSVPKYFRYDLFDEISMDNCKRPAFGNSDRPAYRWFLIGFEGSGTKLHTDPRHTSAWNALISGHKRWFLAKDLPESILKASEGKAANEWFKSVYPTIKEDIEYIEFIQEPGETIYVPAGWHHVVLNLDDTIAVTQNFAELVNIDKVKAILQKEFWSDTSQFIWYFIPCILAVTIPVGRRILLRFAR